MNILTRFSPLARAGSASPDQQTPPACAEVPGAAVADCLNQGRRLARQGEYAAALAAYDAALALAPRLGEIYLGRGMVHFECGAFSDAIADYNSALYYSPGLSSALVERGRASLAQGNPRAAVIDCTAALRANPRSLPAYRVRAEAHAGAGDHDRAAADGAAYGWLFSSLSAAACAAVDARLARLRRRAAPSVN